MGLPKAQVNPNMPDLGITMRTLALELRVARALPPTSQLHRDEVCAGGEAPKSPHTPQPSLLIECTRCPPGPPTAALTVRVEHLTGETHLWGAQWVIEREAEGGREHSKLKAGVLRTPGEREWRKHA